jgi:GNAT superfamily N-acetyltransferase
VMRMPELTIERVLPADDAGLTAFHEVYEAAEDADARLSSQGELGALLGALLGAPRSASYADGLTAFLSGSPVGAALLTGSVRDNLGLAQVQLWVTPTHRRARIGTRLFAAALTEVERRRSLPVEGDLLDRLTAEAASRHGSYEIRTSVGRVPADLRASYVDLDNLLLREMPHGDLDVEAKADTVDDLVAFEDLQEAAGRTRVSAFAIRDGAVAAFSDASVPSEGHQVDQLGTLVHPAHRGHRLGLAVKCAQLRVLSETFPDRRCIGTSNAETNEHMVAINTALGFTVHQVWEELAKHLG